MSKESRIKRIWRWYIKGEYHCDECPQSWEDRSYEGECNDYGCYACGECRETCRLIPPVRAFRGWKHRRYMEYWENRRYDGMGDTYQEMWDQRKILTDELKDALKEFTLCYKVEASEGWVNEDGKTEELSTLRPTDLDSFLDDWVPTIQMNYESIAHPVVRKKLSQEWKELLKKTFGKIFDPICPYLPRKRR